MNSSICRPGSLLESGQFSGIRSKLRRARAEG